MLAAKRICSGCWFQCSWHEQVLPEPPSIFVPPSPREPKASEQRNRHEWPLNPRVI